ncbi:MAG: T9SS type A sorting domain-containing protein [Bacteroidetes bacterium]|nr:T9SS type A sorting domain-containing protein [Bacteroidota bacterium]
MNSSVKKINIFLTDLQGQIIIEQQNVNWIDISNQPKGFYIAFLTDLQGGLIKKIRVIKE